MARIKMKTADLTIEEAFADFIASKKAKGVADKTLQTYHYHFAAVAKHLDIYSDIGDLDKKKLDGMIAGMRDSGMAATSINSYTRTLKSFLSWCNEEGLTATNIKLYRCEEAVKNTYTDAELKKLLKKPPKGCTFPDYRNWVIVNLLLNSGCRAATIRNIKIADVDLAAANIAVRHSKNKRMQYIPLCGVMIGILRDYMKLDLGEWLFPNENGKQLTESGLQQAIQRYNLSRGVQKTSIHLFRHSYAERYLKNGGNAFTLQKLLNHSTLSMTRHYCRIYDADLAKDYDKFSPLATLKAGV